MADTPSANEQRPDPDVIARLVANAPRIPDAGPCLDATTVAGYAEGRLIAAEREVVERHICVCDTCREEAVALARERTVAAPAPRRGRLHRLVAAAAAVAAVVVAAFVILRSSSEGPKSTEVELAQVARSLAEARPDVFGDFRPLGADETLAPALLQKRGATLLLAPAGKVIETRPSLRWEEVPGVARWKVSLATAEGDLLWSRDASTSSLVFPQDVPALAPGERYVWEASGDGPLGPEGGRRAFDVASKEERAAFDAARAAIDADVTPRLRALVLAQWELRRGLYLAAEDDARRFVEANPGEALGVATLAAARRALGAEGAR